MRLVTVITPTYNRGKNLECLFESLQKQTCNCFEWMIVDDGSVDDTRERVEFFKSLANFPIHYIYKQNGGKHTALNVGIQRITTELTFIVDSDDTVVPNGIETIIEFYDKYKNETKIGVWSFLKSQKGRGVVLKMPEDEIISSYAEERIRSERPGEMAEVFLTSALQKFPFPEFSGEKFLSEDVVWIPVGLSYKTVFVNRVIYEYEYLQDGLTQNDKKHKFQSPLGSMMRGKMLMNCACGVKANIKGAIIYNCYRCEVSEPIPACLKEDNPKNRLLLFLTWPLGIVYNKKWKR